MIYRSEPSESTGSSQPRRFALQGPQTQGFAGSRSIVRHLGVTFRTTTQNGMLNCRPVHTKSLEYVEMHGTDCECYTEPKAVWRGGQQHLLIVLQQEGEGCIMWKGLSYPLRRGEWAVLPGTAEYRSTSRQTLRIALLRIVPGEQWPSQLQEKSFCLRSCNTPDDGAFVSGFLRRLLAAKLETAEKLYAEVSHALLLLLAFYPMEAGRSTDLTERIRRYILARLRDPELSLDQVASGLQCSKRSLHKAFSQEGISISDFMWSERLQRCRRDLEEPSARKRSITEIALSWGFSSPSHFSTLFKARFHESPRSYRGRFVQPVGEIRWISMPIASSDSSLPHRIVA